jgi:hypothetical protein
MGQHSTVSQSPHFPPQEAWSQENQLTCSTWHWWPHMWDRWGRCSQSLQHRHAPGSCMHHVPAWPQNTSPHGEPAPHPVSHCHMLPVGPRPKVTESPTGSRTGTFWCLGVPRYVSLGHLARQQLPEGCATQYLGDRCGRRWASDLCPQDGMTVGPPPCGLGTAMCVGRGWRWGEGGSVSVPGVIVYWNLLVSLGAGCMQVPPAWTSQPHCVLLVPDLCP